MLSRFSLDWLFSEAGIGWIAAIVSAAVWLTTIIWRHVHRNKPTRIVCEEINKESLVWVNRWFKDRIGVTLEDRPVSALGMLSLEIWNEGSDSIIDPTLSIVVPEGTEILVARFDSENAFERQCQTEFVSLQEVSLHMPFINPVREHGQRLRLAFAIDGELRVAIRGYGAGWSVRHVVKKDSGFTYTVFRRRAIAAALVYSCMQLGALVGLYLQWGQAQQSKMDFGTPIFLVGMTLGLIVGWAVIVWVLRPLTGQGRTPFARVATFIWTRIRNE